MNDGITVFHLILLIGFAIFVILALVLFFQAIYKNKKNDYAPPRGKVMPAAIYSFTVAMSPLKKESAFMHLPTYTAGMIFHIGTFLSFLWLIILFFNIKLNTFIIYGSALFIFTASLCGIGILFKRILLSKLRSISNADDYFSNMLVTSFQIITALTILFDLNLSLLFIYSAFLFIYIPFGKLKHTIYFFAARIHLALFYGKRGIWGPIRKH